MSKFLFGKRQSLVTKMPKIRNVVDRIRKIRKKNNINQDKQMKYQKDLQRLDMRKNFCYLKTQLQEIKKF
jgi:hypothetical protein